MLVHRLRPSWLPLTFATGWIIGFFVAMETRAQSVRYQLGKQVIAFEETFESRCLDPDARAKPLKPLQKAVQAFFALSLPEAERSIDLARLSLLPSDQELDLRALLPLRLKFSKRWLDESEPVLSLSLQESYERTGDWPKPLTLRVKIELLNNSTSNEPSLVESRDFLLESLDWKSSLLFPGPGDFVIKAELRWDRGVLTLPWTIVSVSSQRNERLEKVQNWIKSQSSKIGDARLSSIKLNASILKSLGSDRYLETDYPSNRLLSQVEAWIEETDRSATNWKIENEGQYWLDLGGDRQTGVVRLQLPTASDSQNPFPTIVAYHGAGGSENMFFDAYGAGRLATLAKQHGYLLVTPRQPLMGGLINLETLLGELSDRIPLDRNRVVVLGHSMGAAQSISQIDKCPQAAQKAVILGGGRGVSRVESWNGIKVFAAAGDQDFGRGGVEAFAGSLKGSNPSTTLKVYSNTEHLGIVQVAWSDIFEWLAD